MPKALKIKVDRRSGQPLYAQVRDALRGAIEDGKLAPGDRLPTVDAFAKQVGVTQATIRRALKDLKATGQIDSHVGRGTFVVDPASRPEPAAAPEPPRPAFARLPLEPVDPEFALAARRLRMGIAESLESLNVLSRRPGLIHLDSGEPDPSVARAGVLDDMVAEAMKAGQAAYQGYAAPMGSESLRRRIALRLSSAAHPIEADQIMITNGSQQAIAVLAQAALEEGRRVICETPCYMGIPRAFGAIGHWVESLPRDEQGPMVERLQRIETAQRAMVYLCPELHNPMGTDLSAERRAALIAWARANDGLLVADEIFRDLRFDSPPRRRC